jgi:hypothetical protein
MRPCGAVVGIGRAAQFRAAEHPGCDVEGVGCGPGGVGGAGRVGRGAVADVIPGGAGPAGSMLVGGAAVGRGDPARDGDPGRRPGLRLPAAAELREDQVGSELAVAEPDHSPGACRVLGQGNGVAGDLAGDLRALALADQDAGVVEAGEETLLCARGGSRGADLAAQGDTGAARPSRSGRPAPSQRALGAWRQCGPRARSARDRGDTPRTGKRHGP